MSFYEFSQNNSGGSFDIDDERGLGPRVWVEADSADEANSRAERLGIYFDGAGDCPCCGNRWHETYDDGEAVPEVNPRYDFSWHSVVYVHLRSGKILRLTEPLGPLGLQAVSVEAP